MKTVFVLGAGVSKAYDYPTGGELIGLIKERLKGRGKSESLADLACYESLQRLNLYSIDAFIHEKPEHEKVAKSLIAEILFEKEDISYEPDPKHDFYRYIFNKVRETGFDEVGFISFNYDRSLEYFLGKSLAEQNPDKSLSDWYSYIFERTIHVYGRLPGLEGEKHYNMENTHYQLSYGSYKDDFKGPRIIGLDESSFDKGYFKKEKMLSPLRRYAQKSFKTISPEIEPNQEAKDMIESAERVFFLGFAYHDLNMKTLGYRFSRNDSKRIAGTCHKLGQTNKRRIERLYPGIELYNAMNLKFFEEYFSITDPADDCEHPPNQIKIPESVTNFLPIDMLLKIPNKIK